MGLTLLGTVSVGHIDVCSKKKHLSRTVLLILNTLRDLSLVQYHNFEGTKALRVMHDLSIRFTTASPSGCMD